MFFFLTVSALFLFSGGFPLFRSLGIQCHCQKSGISFHFASSFFCCCSLLNTLKANLPIEKGSFQMHHLIFATFSWYLRHSAQNDQIYHSNVFRGPGICISIMSVGLINLFQKFGGVFICFFAEFLEFCSNCIALVLLSKPCQDAPKNCALISVFLPHWGPNLVQLWVLLSRLQVQKILLVKEGCNLSN